MKFLFGDIVVVCGNLIGVVVKSWETSCKEKEREFTHDVYVRSLNKIINFPESEIQRYMVRHKELDENEMVWQENSLK